MSMNVTYIPYPEFKSLEYLINAKLPTTGDVNSRLRFLTETTVNASKDISDWAENLLRHHHKVDLVIYDNMAIWGYVAAQRLGMANACSITIMATNKAVMQNTGDGGIYLTLSSEVSEPLQALHNKNVHGIQSFTDIMTCEYNPKKILYTSQYLQRHPSFFPINDYIFFPKRCDDNIISKRISDKTKIYVSFGTVYNSDVELYTNILDTITNKGYEIIVSVGGSENTFNAIKKHNNYTDVAVEKFVDQESLLPNIDIFITHAGLNSASESICHLVPMITIPLVGDQNDIAKSLLSLGGGYLVQRQNISENIEIAITHVINNLESYQANLSKIKESLNDNQAAESALGILEEMMGTVTLDEL